MITEIVEIPVFAEVAKINQIATKSKVANDAKLP